MTPQNSLRSPTHSRPRLGPRSLLLALAAVISVSCTQDKGDGPFAYEISAASIEASDRSPADKAEELAKGAEMLLTVQGFAQALEMADLALKKDPKNLRANFVRAIVLPLMPQKGILTRIRPLAEKTPALLKEYNRLVADTKSQPKSNYTDFLFDGEPDITTEKQLQAQVDIAMQSLDELRKFTKANKDSELTIRANALIVTDIVDRYVNSCEIITTEAYEYKLICPKPEARHLVTLNRADFETLQHMTAYYWINLAVHNAYDVAGATKVSGAHEQGKAAGKPMTAQQIADELLTNQKFVTLRTEAKLKDIRKLGLDLVGGLNWVMSQQATLCPAGWNQPRNRVGMFFNLGVCIGPAFKPFLDIIDSFLAGKLVELYTPKNDTSYTTQHKGIIALNAPFKDLRKFGPYKFNGCSQLVSVGDQTLGGIFPKDDFNMVLQYTNEDCEN